MSGLACRPCVDLKEEYPPGAELVLHPMQPLLVTCSMQHSPKRYRRKFSKLGFFKAVKATFGKDIFTEPWPEQEESSAQHVVDSESMVRTATFIQRLRINEWKPSQLMLVSLSGGAGPSSAAIRYTAMIFDPAVFRCNLPDVSINPVQQMQAYFSQDVHARSSLTSATCLPQFHGSFWAEWSARRVGVILVEDVGINRTTCFLNQLQPHDGTIDNDRHKRIIADVLKADSEAWSAGVEYRIWTPGNLLLRMADDKIFLVDLARSMSTIPKVPTGQEMLEKWTSGISMWHYALTCAHWLPLPTKPRSHLILPDEDFLIDCLKLLGLWTDEIPSNRYNLRPRK